MISRTRLYELRHQWLADKTGFAPQPSGGNHYTPWPPAAHDFLANILPHSQPLNFALLANELARRLDFHRSRPAVAHYVQQHFPPACRPTTARPQTPTPLHHQRRLNTDGTLDFLGQNWPVATLRQKTVTLVHHPEQCFWVIPQTPDPKHPVWPTVLAHHRL